MTAGQRRTDRASRVIAASPPTLYAALTDREALASWLPPEGAKGEIDLFEPWQGGAFRMTLTFDRSMQNVSGKTSAHSDVVKGRFVKLVPDRQVVQAIIFVSDDPDFAGTMTMTWTLSPVSGGTEVAILCENVPVGISAEDHRTGLNSTLENLATFSAERA